VERLAILPIDAPKTKEIESATIVDRRVTLPIHAPTHVPSSSDTVIYFSTTTQPTSQGKGEGTSKRLKMVMTQIWMATTRRIGSPKIEVIIKLVFRFV
jgi:hypothetical protein